MLQEFKGYVFKIMGGQDKEGFPMKQGVLVPGRVRLLMSPGDSCFRGFGRRKGERRRKTVRGCIVSNELSVLNLMITKHGQPSFHSIAWNQTAHWVCFCCTGCIRERCCTLTFEHDCSSAAVPSWVYCCALALLVRNGRGTGVDTLVCR